MLKHRFLRWGKLCRGDYMRYEDPNMEEYWNSLPTEVQVIINATGVQIESLGMLRKLGDYYQNGSGCGEGAIPNS